MTALGSATTGSSVPTGAESNDTPGSGGPFPGIGGAPPAVAPASSAGATGLVSDAGHTHAQSFGGSPPAVAAAGAAGTATTAARSDHTHAGLNQLTTADPALGVATAAAIATLTQFIIASWTVANVRWYAVDGVNGNDSNAGFSDVSMAAAGLVAKKTLAGLGAIFPRVGAGRKVVVAIAAGTYAGGLDTFLQGCGGYAQTYPIVRGTSTNATAGATAFQDDTADATYAGGVTVIGLNAAGYNPTGTPTNQVIQGLKVGGAAPAFPAEPLAPLGWRLRFDSATTTAALRNICRQVATVTTDTLSLATTLPAVPVAGDTFYLEQAGVVVGATNLVGGPSSNIAFGSFRGLQLVGIRVNGTMIAQGLGVSFAFCGTGALAMSASPSTYVSQTYVHSSLGTLTVGGGCHSTGNVTSNSGGTYHLQGMVGETLGQFLEASTLNWNSGSVFGTGMLVGGGSPCDAGFSSAIGSVPGQFLCRILGSNVTGLAGLALNDTKVRLGNLQITGAGVRPGIAVAGISDVVQHVGTAVTGATGNTDAGVSFVGSACRWATGGAANSLTGTVGDVKLGGGQILTWAAAAATGIRDSLGTLIVGAVGALSLISLTGVIKGNAGSAQFSYLDNVGVDNPGTVTNAVNPLRRPTSLRLMLRLRATLLAGGVGNNCTLTLYKNGVATAMQLTIPAGDPQFTKYVDGAHPILFSDGDDFDLRLDEGADIEAGTMFVSATLEYAA